MTITEIKKTLHDNGSHWFDKETIKHWGTKIESPVYDGPGGIYFVTSEWKGTKGREQGKRAYTIRKFNGVNRVHIVGDLWQYSDRETARDKAKELARD